MDEHTIVKGNTFSEVNLKVLIEKILARKWLVVFSLIACLSVAYAYNKIAHPTYEAHTSLLIDPFGKSRALGESKYVEGGVSLIGAEKNLYNEIGILKSYNLISSALEELDFELSYFAGNWFKKRQYYHHFPFSVELIDTAQQAYGVPFEVKMIDDSSFQLSVDANEVSTGRGIKGQDSKILEILEYSGTYEFGEVVRHEYFSFIIHPSSADVPPEEFDGLTLSFQINSLDGLTKAYQENLKVQKFDTQSSILQLYTRGPVLDKEIKFLNKLTANFIQSKFSERSEIATSKRSFIEAQLQSITDSLGRAERKLESFKKGAQAVDLNRSATNNLDELQRLEAERGQIELNIKYYNSVLKYIGNSKTIDKIVAPSVAGVDDPLLNENLVELKRLNNERSRISFYKGKKSYDLKILDEQIKNTTFSLYENLRNLVKSSRLALQDKNRRIGQIEQSINRLPSSEKKLVNLERKSTLYENLYNYLNQELAKTDIASADDIADTKVLDKAQMIGVGPVAPQEILIMLLAVFVGLLIPLLWIIFSESFSESLDSVKQLESLTSLPVLGGIGHARTLPAHMLNPAAQWQVEEDFRNLAASLSFQFDDKGKNVIGITSTVAGEGKTFAAVNLAAALARGGKRVLLLDLNLRHPAVGQAEQTASTHSLATFLLEESCSLESIVQPFKGVPNLYYIPVNDHPHDSHQLLGSLKFKSMLSALRYEYDFLLLDTPALGLVSDYLLLAPHIDIHLYILRQGLSKFTFLNKVHELRANGGMEDLLLVLNDTNTKSQYKGAPYPRPREARKKSLVGSYFERKKKLA